MSSSKPAARQVPPPPNSRAGNVYTRFIPREELQGFANWTPGSFGEGQAPPAKAPTGAEAEAAEASANELRAVLNEARQAGYEAGYRDGLVALESFKQSFAQQFTAQFGTLLGNFDRELGALEQRIAAATARVATQLARQVVRSELAARPELVAMVAQEAVHAVLLSAKHIAVKVHPSDHAVVAAGAADALASRGARLVPLASIERGGCLVETDAGNIDAGVAARWNDAVHALGTDVGWEDADADASRDDFR
jgi:flagellar assembly protein FliH